MGKLKVIRELDHLLKLCQGKVAILDALDRDTSTSDAYDMHDQINGMYVGLKKVRETSLRAELVIPKHVTTTIEEN
tara:strand:+ start:206 stop:433 length:228 start_codon:yes stop_codon:yes gene_type:complete